MRETGCLFLFSMRARDGGGSLRGAAFVMRQRGGDWRKPPQCQLHIRCGVQLQPTARPPLPAVIAGIAGDAPKLFYFLKNGPNSITAAEQQTTVNAHCPVNR
jgi:hypothetical protein